jgi:hypothetical protein
MVPMILAPPARDAFVLIVDLQSYPANVFFFAAAFGLLIYTTQTPGAELGEYQGVTRMNKLTTSEKEIAAAQA